MTRRSLGVLSVVASAAAVLAAPGPAASSLIVYQDTTLAQAVLNSTIVVRATYLRDADQNGPVYLFRVEELLRGTAPAAGETVSVHPAHYTEWSWAMELAERGGARRSPLIHRLPSPPAAPLVAGERYCVLLTDSIDPQALELAVDEGHVPETSCAEVRQLLAAPVSPPSPGPTPR